MYSYIFNSRNTSRKLEFRRRLIRSQQPYFHVNVEYNIECDVNDNSDNLTAHHAYF